MKATLRFGNGVRITADAQEILVAQEPPAPPKKDNHFCTTDIVECEVRRNGKLI